MTSRLLSLRSDEISLNSANFTFKYDEIESILSAGLYSSSEMNDYRQFLAYPVNKIQANEYLTSNTILSNTHHNENIDIHDIISVNDINLLSTKVYDKIKSNILIFGAYSGAILGILFIFQFIAYVNSTAVNLIKSA